MVVHGASALARRLRVGFVGSCPVPFPVRLVSCRNHRPWQAWPIGRHGTRAALPGAPNLTVDVYAGRRNERLSELAEGIGENVLFEPRCAKSVPRKSVEARTVSPRLLKGNDLKGIRGNGGGGIRTPVPRCFKPSVYMHSRSIGISPHRAPSDRLSDRLFRRVSPRRPGRAAKLSLLIGALVRPAGKVWQDGWPI